MKKLKLTEASVTNISTPEQREEYQDTEHKFFRLRVSPSGAKSFLAYKRLKGGTNKRITIGRHDQGMKVKDARAKAIEHVSYLTRGEELTKANKESQEALTTFDSAFENYLSDKKLKTQTVKTYRSLYTNYLFKFEGLALNEISRTMVESWYKSIESGSQANGALRVLNAVYNYATEAFLAADGKSLITDIPTKVIAHKRLKHSIQRKQSHVRNSEFPTFYRTINEVRAQGTITQMSICDAMLFALYTGLRKEEVLGLKWNQINKDFISIEENKASRPLELPITSYLKEIIERDRLVKTEYVFPADNDYGKIIEPKKVVNKVKQLADCSCGWHDLRRTFLTIGESLDVGIYTLKRLVNHALTSDVTEGYLVLTGETLRKPSEQIHQKISNLLIGKNT